MGVPPHGAAALCMPGEKTGNKYAVSQYSAGFPQHRILRTPSRSRQIQTKRGIFSDDDSDNDDHDDSQRERTRTVPYCPGGLFGVLNCRQFSPPSHRHQHISQLIIRPSAASSPRSSPQEARAAKGIPPRGGEADRDCKKILAENNTSLKQPCPFSSVDGRRPTAPATDLSVARTPPPLARSRVKR